MKKSEISKITIYPRFATNEKIQCKIVPIFIKA